MYLGRGRVVLQHNRQPRTLFGDTRVQFKEHIVRRWRQLLGRRHHHGIGAQILGHLAQIGRRGDARVRRADAHADRAAARAGDIDRNADERLTLLIRHAVRLTEHARDGHSLRACIRHECDRLAEAVEVERLVGIEGRRHDWVHTFEEGGHRSL